MSKCKFIDECTHATGWCNSSSVVMKCEWFNEKYEESLRELYGIKKEDYLEGKMEQKFKCVHCGEEYKTPEEMAHCILSCQASKLAKIEQEKREKLAKEKEDRKKKIIHYRKDLAELEQMYLKDYGEHIYSLREPYTKTIRFNGDWGKFFEDCFK